MHSQSMQEHVSIADKLKSVAGLGEASLTGKHHTDRAEEEIRKHSGYGGSDAQVTCIAAHFDTNLKVKV